MSEHTEQIPVNKVDTNTLWNRTQSAGQGKTPSRRAPALSPRKLPNRWSSLWVLPAPPQQVKYKRTPTTIPQTCLTNFLTHLKKCRYDKLCIMTAPPVGQKRA